MICKTMLTVDETQIENHLHLSHPQKKYSLKKTVTTESFFGICENCYQMNRLQPLLIATERR